MAPADGLLHHLVGHAVLVGVLGVAHAFLDPGLNHGIGGLAMGERADVILEALLVLLLDDGPLAVVDGAVSAAALRGLLQHQHFLAALVGADQRRPHAGSAVSDDQQVAFVIPSLGHPVGGCLGAGGAAVAGAARQRRTAGHGCSRDAGALQERATRHVKGFLHVFLLGNLAGFGSIPCRPPGSLAWPSVLPWPEVADRPASSKCMVRALHGLAHLCGNRIFENFFRYGI